MNKKIVMAASNATAFNGFCGMIKNICKYIPEYDFQFIILVQACNNTNELMEKHGLNNRSDVTVIDFEKEFASSYHSFRAVMYNHVGCRTSLGKFLLYKDRVIQIKETKTKLLDWFMTVKPDLVLLYGDRMLGVEVTTASVAKACQIPSVFSTLGYSLSKITKTSRSKKIYEIGRIFPLFDNYVLRQCPTLFTKINGRRYRFYDSIEALAGYRNQCISLNPWYNGAGEAQFVAARDQEQYDDLKEGLTEEVFNQKVVLTGDVEQRDIKNSYINRRLIIEHFREKYGITGEKIVIIAIPRYAGHDRFEYPFENYINNVDKLLCTLRKLDNGKNDLLLSIHPKCKLDDYCAFEEKYDCRIIKEPLRDYIGIAYMYIYEELSTTGYWGKKILEIPSFAISKDFSGRDYTDEDFRDLENFFVTNTCKSVICGGNIQRANGQLDYYDFLGNVIREE